MNKIYLNSFKINSNILEKKASLLIGHEKIRNSLCNLQNFIFSNKSYVKHANFLDLNGNILLYGPPGTGKTSICYEFMRKAKGASHYNLNFSTLISEKLGQTSKNFNIFFENILEESKKYKIILLIEEIETLLPSRKNGNDLEDMKRALTIFMHYLENMNKNVIILCTTNHIELLDAAIKRRFCMIFKVATDKKIIKNFLISPLNPFRKIFLNDRCTNTLVHELFDRGRTISDIKFMMKSLYFECENKNCKNITVKNMRKKNEVFL